MIRTARAVRGMTEEEVQEELDRLLGVSKENKVLDFSIRDKLTDGNLHKGRGVGLKKGIKALVEICKFK